MALYHLHLKVESQSMQVAYKKKKLSQKYFSNLLSKLNFCIVRTRFFLKKIPILK